MNIKVKKFPLSLRIRLFNNTFYWLFFKRKNVSTENDYEFDMLEVLRRRAF